MPRPKGSTNKPKAEPEAIEPEVQEPEVKQTANYAKHTKWIYHNEEEPRLVKAGDVIPVGWTSDISKLSVGWRTDFYGKWIREA